jgi:tRNA-Thr(GGU) m(6)t(6)A37 methyltransferase TsaA
VGEIVMEPIGVVRSTRSAVEDDDWDREHVRIELDPARFGPEALAGLDTFSHVEVIFHMDRVEPSKIERGARHPRGETRWPKVGVFAQRAKNRPNQIGLTVCRIVRVDGRTLEVEGLDAVDGTPVLDLKPWMSELGPRGEVKQPVWASELMSRYWK